MSAALLTASFEVRDLHATHPDDYRCPEWDVIARCSDGTLRHSDECFGALLDAQAYRREMEIACDDLGQWTVVPNATKP